MTKRKSSSRASNGQSPTQPARRTGERQAATAARANAASRASSKDKNKDSKDSKANSEQGQQGQSKDSKGSRDSKASRAATSLKAASSNADKDRDNQEAVRAVLFAGGGADRQAGADRQLAGGPRRTRPADHRRRIPSVVRPDARRRGTARRPRIASRGSADPRSGSRSHARNSSGIPRCPTGTS